MGFDPVSLGIGATQFGIGALQSLIGGNKQKKAQEALENLQTPTYNANSSILDYYNKALQRYNTNPYQSQQYQYGIQEGNRNQAAGVNALQGRNSAVGGISRLIALSNNNALQTGISAENEQNQRFGQLGGATQMKSADDQYGFQINKLMPYQKQLDLLTAKAGGGGQVLNAGLSNIFGGLSGAASNFLGNDNGSANNSNNGNASNSNSSWYSNPKSRNINFTPTDYQINYSGIMSGIPQ